MAAAAGACRLSGSACSTTTPSLDAAWDIVKDWTAEERQKLRDDVPDAGLAPKIRNRTMLELATETLALARARTRRAARARDPGGQDETRYLDPLEDLVSRGTTPAEELLAKFHGPWDGSVEPIFAEYAY